MYQRILVPVDGSATSNRGLEEAIKLASLTGGRLKFIYVVDELSFYVAMDGFGYGTADLPAVLRDAGRNILAAATDAANKAGVASEAVLCDRVARVHEVVTDEASSWPADLIVIGTHGRRGISRVVMGSSAEAVVRLACVPVLLVRTPEAAAMHEAKPESVTVTVPTAALSIE